MRKVHGGSSHVTPVPGSYRSEFQPRRTVLQEGRDTIRRVSQRVCLLERRLQGGGERVDLLVLVQEIKFAVEDLRTLFQRLS